MQRGPDHRWFRDDEAPLIRLTIPETFHAETLSDALGSLRGWLLNEVDRPYGLVIDVLRLEAIGAKERKMIADYERSYQHVERRFSTGQAFVLRSTIIRGVMTAVFWLSPPAFPYRFFERLVDAERWAREDLERGLAAFPSGSYWRSREER